MRTLSLSWTFYSLYFRWLIFPLLTSLSIYIQYQTTFITKDCLFLLLSSSKHNLLSISQKISFYQRLCLKNVSTHTNLCSTDFSLAIIIIIQTRQNQRISKSSARCRIFRLRLSTSQKIISVLYIFKKLILLILKLLRMYKILKLFFVIKYFLFIFRIFNSGRLKRSNL